MTECESNIESESVSQFTEAAKRLCGDDSGWQGPQLRPPLGRARHAPAGRGGRVRAPAACREIPPRIEGQTMQGFLSCSALEGRPIAAFIFGWYIQHNPCFIHVAKFALFNRVFSFVVQ